MMDGGEGDVVAGRKRHDSYASSVGTTTGVRDYTNSKSIISIRCKS